MQYRKAANREKHCSTTLHIWTGYTIEELRARKEDKADIKELFKNVNIIIDGRFDETKKELDLPFRGSTNQRILRKGHDF